MTDNIIDFNTIRNGKMLDGLKVTEIGSINITVYEEENTKYALYYILPDRKELIPIVDLLDETLTNNCFKLSQELKVNKL
ncbi:MAG: hypothetical protein HFJ36_03145 [Clostridia bacterium]|nr:hypothetical protein [Clostridia bacterium]